MTKTVFSEYHGHEIVPWAVEERCYFCNYPASHKVEESGDRIIGGAYFHSLTAYVCCDHFWYKCKNDDGPKCSRCRHPWYLHEKKTFRTRGPATYECSSYAGMGDNCGCQEKKPV